MNGTVIHSLLIAITKAIVDHPELVLITATPSERGIKFDIQVAESDLGKVIGRQGRTAHSIRNIIAAVATKRQTPACVNIGSFPQRAPGLVVGPDASRWPFFPEQP